MINSTPKLPRLDNKVYEHGFVLSDLLRSEGWVHQSHRYVERGDAGTVQLTRGEAHDEEHLRKLDDRDEQSDHEE